jgi:hypothetical protein
MAANFLFNTNAINIAGGEVAMALASGLNNFGSSGPGTLDVSGGTLTLASTFVRGGITNIHPGATVNLAGAEPGIATAGLGGQVTNDGTIRVLFGGKSLFIGDITNTGTVQVDAGAILAIDTTMPGTSFKNNSGTVHVSSGASLDLSGSGILNTGTIRVDGALTATGPIDNTNGVLIAQNGGSLALNGGFLNGPGGALDVLSGGSLSLASFRNQAGGSVNIFGSANLASTNMINDGLLQVNSGASLTVSGTGNPFTNTGTLKANGGGVTFITAIDNTHGALTIQNGSVVNLERAVVNGVGGIIDTGTGSTLNISFGLRNDAGATLTSSGTTTITSQELINGGLMQANAGGLLHLQGAPLTNSGTVSANGGAVFVDGIHVNNQGGAITTSPGGLLLLSNTTISGGQINNNGGTIRAFFGTQDKIGGAQGVQLTNGNQLIVDQNAILLIDTSGTGGNFTNLSGGVLSGGTYTVSGTLEITDADITRIGNGILAPTNVTLDGPTASITRQDGVTNALSDLNRIALGSSLTLENGATLTLNGSMDNGGVIIIGAGSSLTTTGTYTQDHVLVGVSDTVVNGTLNADTLILSGGRILGDGTIHAAVSIDNGIIEPGDAPGPITMAGLIEGPGVTTQIDLLNNSQFGEIIITGSGNNNVVLNGQLLVLLSAGAQLTSGLFTIVSDPNGTIQGDFTSGNIGTLGSGENYREFLSADRHTVFLDVTIPEPGTWVLLASALALLVWRVRLDKRHRLHA